MKLQTYILNMVNAKEFYKHVTGTPGYGSNIICPFHKDENPSLSVRDDGSAYCYGCKRKWRNIIDFYKDYKDISLTRAMYTIFNKHITPLVPRGLYVGMFKNMLRLKEPKAWLLNRGIGTKTICRHLMGYDENTDRITLPIFNEWGYCVNIRLFKFRKNNEPKVVSYKKGMGKVRLFPLFHTAHKEIYILEGEMDALLAIHLGLNAITTTGGAYGWRKKFAAQFKDKIVYICYDNDTAGQAGARIVATQLLNYADRLYNIILPEKFGKDFSDYMVKRPLEAFLDIVAKTREISKGKRIARKRITEEFYGTEETMVAEINPKKNLLHIIVRVEGSDTGAGV